MKLSGINSRSQNEGDSASEPSGSSRTTVLNSANSSLKTRRARWCSVASDQVRAVWADTVNLKLERSARISSRSKLEYGDQVNSALTVALERATSITA